MSIKSNLKFLNDIFNKLKSYEDLQGVIYWLFIAIIVFSSIGYSIEFSHVWVYEHIGKDSYDFVGNLHATGFVNYKAINYTVNYTTHFSAIENFEIIIVKYKKSSNIFLYLFIGSYLATLLLTIFTAMKNDIKTNFDKNNENNLLSITGVFFSICFGLSSGSYLLLISLRKDYLTQLLILISQKVPYEYLPFIGWDATYQTLCISYIGFAIISILLLTSLLFQIWYLKSKHLELKRGSHAFLLASIWLSIIVFYIFSHLDKYW